MFWSGYYGVCIFFVISGFLITTSALNKWGSLPEVKLQGFYYMRFARIIPLLFSLLLVLSLLHIAGIKGFTIDTDRTSLGRSVFAALTFHINWLELKTGYLPASWDILWSLSIEEAFYLFFPLLCLLIKKEWQFIAIAASLLIISPYARTMLFPGNELADRNYLAYMDAIALGCIASIITRRVKTGNISLNIIAITGWGLFLMVFIFRTFVFNLGLTKTGLNVTLLAIGTALILVVMQKRHESGQQTPSRFTAFLRFLGRNSYEVYLTHMFVVFSLVGIYKILNLNGEWTWLLYILAVLVSGILGELVARYFSNPMNVSIRNRLNNRSTVPATIKIESK